MVNEISSIRTGWVRGDSRGAAATFRETGLDWLSAKGPTGTVPTQVDKKLSITD